MKSLLIIMLSLLNYFIVQSQTFEDYGKFYRDFENLVEHAKSLEVKSIIDQFNVLSNGIKHIPSQNLIRLSRLIAEKGDKISAKKYFIKTIENGFDNQEYANEGVVFDLEELINNYRIQYNLTYKEKIDSMKIWDQCVRTEKCKKGITEVDSSNMILMLNLVEEYGFPSENKVGTTSSNNAIIMILHFDQDKTHEIWGPILREAFSKGFVSPRYYAWIKDRRLAWVLEEEQYYHFIPTPEFRNFGKNKIDEIQKRRDSIGLKIKHKW